jgi:hypothetical protein
VVLLLPVRDQTCTLPSAYTIMDRLSDIAGLSPTPPETVGWLNHCGPHLGVVIEEATSQINFASNVIAVLRAFETGQFFSAAVAISRNLVSSKFGTFARRVRAERLMRKP